MLLERETAAAPKFLSYAEPLKNWFSPALTEAHDEDRQLPSDVLAWLKLHLQKCANGLGVSYCVFRAQQLQHPWCSTPSDIKGLAPRELDVAGLEAQLKYTFANPMRLVEALTHASYSEALTPCSRCLAFVGSPLLEMLLIELVIENTAFPHEAVEKYQPAGAAE